MPVILLFTLSCCSSTQEYGDEYSDDIVGKWKLSEEFSSHGVRIPKEIEFFSDGSVQSDMGGKYTYEDNRLNIYYAAMDSYTYICTVDNGTLTLKSDDSYASSDDNEYIYLRFDDDGAAEADADYDNNGGEAPQNTASLNAFAGIEYTVSGISPYCTIAVNTQNCDEAVQKYVTYTTDKDYYKNGDTATITAELSGHTGDENYTLSSVSSTYTVNGQPEYITSLDGVDISELKSELSDKVSAEKAATSSSTYLFGVAAVELNEVRSLFENEFKSCDNIDEKATYLSALKPIKTSEFNQEKMPYNVLSFFYSVDYTYADSEYTTKGTLWLNVSAVNIVKYPDGSVKWGSKSTDDYDFTFQTSLKGLEDCISTTVMCNSDNYNISEITP